MGAGVQHDALGAALEELPPHTLLALPASEHDLTSPADESEARGLLATMQLPIASAPQLSSWCSVSNLVAIALAPRERPAGQEGGASTAAVGRVCQILIVEPSNPEDLTCLELPVTGESVDITHSLCRRGVAWRQCFLGLGLPVGARGHGVLAEHRYNAGRIYPVLLVPRKLALWRIPGLKWGAGRSVHVLLCATGTDPHRPRPDDPTRNTFSGYCRYRKSVATPRPCCRSQRPRHALRVVVGGPASRTACRHRVGPLGGLDTAGRRTTTCLQA